jgi:hypothetical protein
MWCGVWGVGCGVWGVGSGWVWLVAAVLRSSAGMRTCGWQVVGDKCGRQGGAAGSARTVESPLKHHIDHCQDSATGACSSHLRYHPKPHTGSRAGWGGAIWALQPAVLGTASSGCCHTPASLKTSVGCGVDLPDSGAVVKPTWLLMTTWMVPPVVKPGTLLSCRHSATMPWPAAAAAAARGR